MCLTWPYTKLDKLTIKWYFDYVHLTIFFFSSRDIFQGSSNKIYLNVFHVKSGFLTYLHWSYICIRCYLSNKKNNNLTFSQNKWFTWVSQVNTILQMRWKNFWSYYVKQNQELRIID